MPRYMLGTDISSYIMRRTDAVIRRLQAVPVSDVCISAITKSELMFGVEVSPRRQKDQAALDYAQIRADLKTRGMLIGANDMLIAADARCLGLTLVTNNTREYERVPGLKIENWA